MKVILPILMITEDDSEGEIIEQSIISRHVFYSIDHLYTYIDDESEEKWTAVGTGDKEFVCPLKLKEVESAIDESIFSGIAVDLWQTHKDALTHKD